MLEMITIPEGFCIIGAKDDCTDAKLDLPEKKIWLPSFKIQKTPVSTKLWNTFLNDTYYNWNYKDLLEKVSPSEEHPATYVSWYDCLQFVNWLSVTMNASFSLPSEYQWEKACRGECGQLYPWTNCKPNIEDSFLEIPNFVDNCIEAENFIMGQDTKKQTPFGCLDMWQNVSEWCDEWYSYFSYASNETVVTEFKVYRGGNVFSPGWPRCSWRGYHKPTYHHANLGFRVVQNF